MSDVRKAFSFAYLLWIGACAVPVIGWLVLSLRAPEVIDQLLNKGDLERQRQQEDLERKLEQDVGPPISFTQFSTLQDEMSYSQVVQVLGKPGIQVGEETISDGRIQVHVVIYMWNAGADASISALFHDDALSQNRAWHGPR